MKKMNKYNKKLKNYKKKNRNWLQEIDNYIIFKTQKISKLFNIKAMDICLRIKTVLSKTNNCHHQKNQKTYSDVIK